ncbi:response regulator transcription factor [Streptomyces angustmyceticus]
MTNASGGVTVSAYGVIVQVAAASASRPHRGRSNTGIAEDLFITMATAKSHVSRLLSKLGARARVQLVITAHEMRLVTLPG